MKKKLLILDAFTNGHEAAVAFIKKQGWSDSECEIIFCGTHAKVFERLIEEKAYAVVPVYNSIAGEITEVTRDLAKFRKAHYDLHERNRLDLQINHCLLVPHKVNRAEELEEVMSHEKVIQQCGTFLDAIGIPPDKRSKRDSTGNAAKVLADLGPYVKIGAIAPKAAAEEYGLKILSEDIQDVPDNKTTFVLLENKAVVKHAVVGIIGINGGFGQMLKRFFEQLGCLVIGSDKKKSSGRTNAEVVAESEVVIFSVPIKDTPEVIRSVLSYIRESQLLMDVTSVKQPSVEAMLQSKAQVVGLHPMFRPEVSFDGQTVVVCPARLTLPHWKTWVTNVLAATGSKIKWSTPVEHDSYMTTVQVIPHLGNLISALLIMENKVSVSESLDFTSPFYRVMFSLMGRLLSQSPDLYASIVMENPETLQMLERRIAIEQRLVQIIRNKNQLSFERLFLQAREYFGAEVTREANELFIRINAVLTTLYGKNSVTLELDKAESRPGLLERISGVFGHRGINLSGIHSVEFGGGRLQFTISFDQSRASDEVRRALEEIENWPEPKVKVLD
jgi:prephenate dehydrogenase